MKTLSCISTAVLLCLVFAANAQASETNVTNTPRVQGDLITAYFYWQHERPDLKAACPKGVQAIVTEMRNAANPDGSLPIVASGVWAETAINGCTIRVSPSLWEAINDPNSTGKPEEACITFLHEYGHVLGLWDTLTPGIMDQEWSGIGKVPMCEEWRPKLPVVQPAPEPNEPEPEVTITIKRPPVKHHRHHRHKRHHR